MSNATMTQQKSHQDCTNDCAAGSAKDTGAILITGAGGEMGHALLEALATRYGGKREIVADAQ